MSGVAIRMWCGSEGGLVVDQATFVNPAMPPVGWLGGVVGAAPHGIFVEEPHIRLPRSPPQSLLLPPLSRRPPPPIVPISPLAASKARSSSESQDSTYVVGIDLQVVVAAVTPERHVQ